MLVPVEDAVALPLTGDRGTALAKADFGFDGDALTKFLPGEQELVKDQRASKVGVKHLFPLLEFGT